jgi:hypothetical protein
MAALVLAIGAASVPLTAAVACSCGFPGYAEAIASADVAFVGTVVGEREPALAQGMETARYAFDVSLSKTPMQSPYEMDTTFGNGANCGLDMGVGEEWLVIASQWEGRLETNLCTGTTLTGSLDPEELDRIEQALEPNDPPAGSENSGLALEVPAPILGMLAAVLAVGALSVIAFRRDRVR